MATSFLERIRSRYLPERWPPEDLREVWEEIERYAAFRTSNEGVLRQEESIPWQDRYLISPVPRMISRAKANLLYGESATYTAATEADQERLDYLVTENALDTEAHRGVMISSSEGEVWGKLCVRPDLADVPTIDLVSRRQVIPEFVGRWLRSVTFVHEYPEGAVEVVRLFEHYEAGAIRNEVFRGTRTTLGQEIGLDQYDATAGMMPLILTGIEQPLVAFIPNSIDDDPSRGYSDYAGLESRFYGINRAATIGDTNTELAGKKRALLDAEYTGASGTLREGDIFVRSAAQSDLGQQKPLEMLEYSYDAGQITLWLDHLIDSTLSFGGAAPQLVGRQLEGAAMSGTALRLKMIHSLLEASGAGRYQDRGYARLLHFAQILDSRPTTQLGFGRSWSTPDEKPTIEREDGLPRDDLEASQYVAALAGAEAISVEERVAFLHPDWTEEQIAEEVARLEDEKQASMPVLPPAPEAFTEEPVRPGR